MMRYSPNGRKDLQGNKGIPARGELFPALHGSAKFIPQRYKLMKGISQKAARLSSRNRAIYQKPRTEENFF